MKIKITLIVALLFSVSISSQNLDDFLIAGAEDAQRFAADYLRPANSALVYGINNSWYNNTKTLKRFGFEISIIGNGVFIKDEDREFVLRANEYNNLRFPDNSASKTVVTALGHRDPKQQVILTYDAPIFGGQEITIDLPTGLAEMNINTLPTAFLQASFAPFYGTQVKLRYFPKIDQNDVETGFYGIGLQQDFTAFLKEDSLFPLTVTGLIAYTQLNGEYDLQGNIRVAGSNQRIETETSTMLYQAIVATKLNKINFYGSIGYVDGQSETKLAGEYRVSNLAVFSEGVTDPVNINEDTDGLISTLGANLKLGIFGLNASYSFAEFNSASLGMNFTF